MIHGFYSDGESSKQFEAQLGPAELGAIALRFDNQELLFSVEDVKISSRLGNSARYISLGDAGKFETRDNDAVDLLAKQLNNDSGLLHKLESNTSLIVIATLFTIVVGWAMVKYGIPSAADAIVDALPEKTTDYLEGTVLNRVEQELFEESELSSERLTELDGLFNSVMTKLNIVDKHYVFKIRNAEESVGANALAFPNGTIIMTDQLIELASSDKQIAGVMAHELGHLDAKHSLRQIVRGSIFSFLIASITGDVSAASSAVLSAPAVLMELKYSREFETQADEYAIKYFDCDVQGLKELGDFFIALGTIDDRILEKGHIKEASENTEEKPNVSGFLSTHPASGERQTRIEQHILKNCTD